MYKTKNIHIIQEKGIFLIKKSSLDFLGVIFLVHQLINKMYTIKFENSI